MPTARWPIRPPPLPHELFSSWLVRLASANSIKVGTFLHVIADRPRAFAQDIDRYVPPDLAAAVAAGTGVPVREIRDMALARYAGAIFPQFFRHGSTSWILPLGRYHATQRRAAVQFCPECLRNDATPYFRRYWRLACVVGCAQHGRLLRDMCGHCSAPIAFHRTTLGDRHRFESQPLTECTRCGGDLTTTISEPMLPRLTEFLGALHPSLLHGADVMDTCAGRLPTVEVLAVLHHFSRLLAHGRWGAPLRNAARELGARLPVVTTGERRGFVLEYAPLAVRAALLDSALLLWTRWPTSFSVLCAEHRVWHSALLADFRRAPPWYRRRIRSELYLPGFVPPPSGFRSDRLQATGTRQHPKALQATRRHQRIKVR